MPIYPADNVYEDGDMFATAVAAVEEADPAVQRIDDLLHLAEAAVACGREAYAQYLRFHAERLALENGSFTVIARVWGWLPTSPLA